MIEKDGVIFESERKILEFVGKIKDVAKDKTIPILTVDGELQEVLYRDNVVQGRYKPIIKEDVATSLNLINAINNVVSIKSLQQSLLSEGTR